MLVAFAKKARDVIAEDAYFEKREMTLNIDERSLWRVPDGGGKVQTDLLGTGKCNSTVPRGCGTGNFADEKERGMICQGEELLAVVLQRDAVGVDQAPVYWRMTTRNPRRQLSVRPTRVASKSGGRKRRRVSVEGWKRSAGATR
jgi:hypothetical protein